MRSLLAALALTTLLGTAGGGAARADGGALTLERAVGLAAARHERVAIAGRRAEASEARVRRARAFFFPDLTVSGAYTRQPEASFNGRSLQGENALTASAAANLTVYDARAFPLLRQAQRDRDAARLEASEERRTVAFEAAAAFVRTLALEHVREAAARRLELARQSVADARARLAAQLASSHEVTRTELELASAEREATRAGAEVELARLQLGFLLGEPGAIAGPLVEPAALLALSPTDAAADASALARGARGRRLDLAAGRLRVEALRAYAAEPGRRVLPILGLTGQYRATTEGGIADRNTNWFVSLVLTWVVWDGGERTAERRERTALADVAALGVQLEERGVALEIERALVELRRSRAAAELAARAVEVAGRNVTETTVLFRQGLASALEVSDAGLRLYESEIALAGERYALAAAALDLRAAVGLDAAGEEPLR